jgi:hypothetical protein
MGGRHDGKRKRVGDPECRHFQTSPSFPGRSVGLPPDLPITIRKIQRTSEEPAPGQGIHDFISSPVGAGRSCQSEDRRSVSSFTQAHLDMCDCAVWIEFVPSPCNLGHMNV